VAEEKAKIMKEMDEKYKDHPIFKDIQTVVVKGKREEDMVSDQKTNDIKILGK
jgi:hypothetical protein